MEWFILVGKGLRIHAGNNVIPSFIIHGMRYVESWYSLQSCLGTNPNLCSDRCEGIIQMQMDDLKHWISAQMVGYKVGL